MPQKIRDLKKILSKAGFVMRQGKGSHSNWIHPLLDRLITIARSDGDDAPRYLEKQVREAIDELETISNESDEIQHED